jgi:tRNA 2-selenouridine synthase
MFETTADFKKIVLTELPLIDVRAPIEYEKGAFLNSVNLPIMNDEERRLVGICYKEKGNEEAVNLGNKLVSGSLKDQRIKDWTDFLAKHPQALIYCFRGGQRSQISQKWIYDATGQPTLRLDGGYKAFRNFLIDALAPDNISSSPLVLTGYTGSGKTDLLLEFDSSVDLEGLANHRGSSFGNQVNTQPTQINFENNLAYRVMQHSSKAYKYMLLEDEGRNIGRSYLPKELHRYFKSGELVLVHVDFDIRLENIFDEYVIKSQVEYEKASMKGCGLDTWASAISKSLVKIKKRLGGECYARASRAFEDAFLSQKNTGDPTLHKAWAGILLKEYYDPMYKYQIDNKRESIVFEGNTAEVRDYLNEKTSLYL